MFGSKPPLALVFGLLMAFSSPAANAQEIQFGAQRGPYYVGEPVVVQVVVSGVDSNVDVSCKLKESAPGSLTVQGPRLNRSVSSFTQIINGRMSSRETVEYKFNFVVTANREGEFQVGPFELTYDGRSQEVIGDTFRFGKLENDPDMQLDVSLAQTSVYVGQEVPVTIRWSFAGDMNAVRYAYSKLQIRSPLFDQFSFKDVASGSGTTLSIATAKGVVEIDAEATTERVGGRDFIVVTGTRLLVPDGAGEFSSIPVTCRTQKVMDWGRSLFGELAVRRSAPALAAGTPLDFEVKPIPLNGRPASYAGAIGRGFSLDVSANRSVVRLGDPISLTIIVRGDGNLESVSLPPLGKQDALSANLFQIPAEQATGIIDGSQKQFQVNVRVKDPSVTQIPAIAFSWFDPYEERFSTATSKPIALQVMETQVISAADVVSSTRNSDAPGRGVSTESLQPSAAGRDATERSFVGANLAIVRDPRQLLVRRSSLTASKSMATACYLLALALVAVCVAGRRQANKDQAVAARKKRLKTLRRQVEAASRLPAKEAAEQLARVLRDLLADFSLADRTTVDRLVARCDNIIYCTSAVPDSDVSNIVSQSKRILQDVAGE